MFGWVKALLASPGIRVDVSHERVASPQDAYMVEAGEGDAWEALPGFDVDWCSCAMRRRGGFVEVQGCGNHPAMSQAALKRYLLAQVAFLQARDAETKRCLSGPVDGDI